MKEKIFNAVDGELSNVITFIENELQSIKCDSKQVMQILIDVEEIFINISHYGYKENNGKVKIYYAFDEILSEISITFIDNGIKFNPLEQAQPNIKDSLEKRKIGGLGIFMVKNTVDNIEYKYENDSNILNFVKKVKVGV